MNKKVLKIIAVVFVISLLSFLGYKVAITTKEKNAIANSIKTIPEFELLTLAQKPFTKTDLKKNQNIIFIYFNSECDFCQYEAQSISENLTKFTDTQFVFTSIEPVETIKQFSKQYNLSNPNITFLYDRFNTFSNQFGVTSIPFILIYNKNQELVKKHKGQLNANGILKALNQ